MSRTSEPPREGGLEAPTRHPVEWRAPAFYDEQALHTELARVFDICHGCRRCVNLCNAFPTLFDLVDESDTLEVDGVAKDDYWKVVDQCYLCDLCFLTKCPYVPPHEWNVDFPHLMLQAKAVKFKRGQTRLRDRLLTATDTLGRIAGIPVVAETVNALNRTAPVRRALGIHPDAPLPRYHGRPLRKRVHTTHDPAGATPGAGTTGKLALFVTCYGNYNAPEIVEDLLAVLGHNDLPVALVPAETCCGMPKLELGDLVSVEKLQRHNIPVLAALVDQGYDLTAPVPSCVLMFKQELPLLFPDDAQVAKVSKAFFDPFEYLMLRHRAGLLNTGFKHELGRIAYHIPCHQRVQKIGPKTRDLLELVAGTEVVTIERCSGHDGTYAVKRENFAHAQKICRPVARQIDDGKADWYTSDCPMAAEMIGQGLSTPRPVASPFALVRRAYGI